MAAISGYVLEPIRVGQSNGPFTQTPDVFISNQTAFDASYPSDESAPRTDYLVMLTSESKTRAGFLEYAQFGFTKNETVDRFAYDAQLGSFKPLRGAAPVDVGVLGVDSNTKRLRVTPPVQAGVTAAPYRLSVGATTWSVALVLKDTDFTDPASLTARTVQLSKETGNLNWRTSDLTTSYLGQRVHFQQQQYYSPKDSTGRLGIAPTSAAGAALMLNPLPGPGQFPRLRFGYGLYLTSAEVTAFSSNPTAGTVEWLRATGELKFNSADATANVGTPVYYDGVVFATSLALPTQSLGSIADPAPITILPSTMGADLIFRVDGLTAPAYYRFPTVTYRTSFDSVGKKGEVQVNPITGKVQFSAADRSTYAGKTATLSVADVPIERGISVRFRRNPVNLDGALATVKDVTRIYTVQGATFANPIVASPQVTLPSLPVDAPAYPRVVHVVQGQGSYVSDNFRDLNASPAAGLGYYIDFETGTLFFAQRKEQLVIPLLSTTSEVGLPDPLLLSSNLKLELGSGTQYRTLVIGDDVLVDTTSGVVSLASTNASLAAGSASISGSTLTDLSATFITNGVKAGQLVVLSDRGLLYSVETDPVSETALQLTPQPASGVNLAYAVYEDREVLADRYFDEVVLVDPSTKVERILSGTARTLTPKVDYQLQAELGLVQFSERLLSGEQVRITYMVAPPNTTPPTVPGDPVTEYASFLIRKEVTADHPSPTSTLSFNAAGLPVASNPPPAVFRGGRPQKLGTQCVVNTELSQITFLPDAQLTDALPHGATVNPSERVYIDYYVTQAVGGEKTFTVLQPPLQTAKVTIEELSNQFKVHGDQTAKFPAGHLLRIENELIFLLGSSSYDANADETTVVLYDNGLTTDGFSQVFPDSFVEPKLYVSSGPAPITVAAMTPAYFVTELSAYEPIARGSNTFLIPGDQTAFYRPGTILLFTDSGKTFTDFVQVSGVAYDPSTGRTKVMLTTNVIRQYVSGQQILLRSVRPIFAPNLTDVQTTRIPKLGQPYFVYRQVAGQAGRVLMSAEYTIDASGHITFVDPLVPLEEFSICYTGLSNATPGVNLRASYTSMITPSATNGLLGQALIADYYIRSADSFYFRVETMTNFRGEFAAEIAAAASSGSSGPMSSNATQPKLFEQGRKSLYFDERHLANQDRIACASLLYYNDLVNALESYRRQLDGTVVGNNDGLLLFDGGPGRTLLTAPLKNQIDDAVKVSDSLPTTVLKKYYQPGPQSRFYPTAKNFFGVTSAIDPSATLAGTEVLDTKSTNVTQVSNLHFRQAWGVVTEASSTGTLKLDFASGNEPGFADQASKYARLPFLANVEMKCQIVGRDGSQLGAVTIEAVSDNQVVVSGIGGSVSAGSTLYQLQSDDSGYMFTHVSGRDYSFNGESGQVTYVASVGGDPPGNVPLIGSYSYAGSVTFTNTSTEPYKFPALFGGIEDDDGDLSFPIQTPDPASEIASWLATESKLIRVGTGLLRTETTDTKISTGSVVSPNLYTIVDASIGTMNPAPLPGGLVRILTGVNSGSVFRRITSVGTNFLIVSSTGDAGVTLAGYAASASFSYELVVSPNIASGTATSGSVSQLTKTSATFLSSVRVGYTIVLTISGVYYRRQINGVTNTTLTFYPAVPTAVTAGTAFRVENSIATYGNRSGSGTVDYLQEWDAALAGEQALYASYQTALATMITQATAGVSSFGISADTIATLTKIQQSVATVVAPIAALRAKLVPASVSGIDAANTFAVGLLTSDLIAREGQVNARLGAASVTDSVASITGQIVDLLANTERLYDKRYVWIDARINLESGLLVRQEAAVKTRLKAQAEALKQLTKLLAVGST